MVLSRVKILLSVSAVQKITDTMFRNLEKLLRAAIFCNLLLMCVVHVLLPPAIQVFAFL